MNIKIGQVGQQKTMINQLLANLISRHREYQNPYIIIKINVLIIIILLKLSQNRIKTIKTLFRV